MPFIPLEVFANNPSTTVTSGGTTALGTGAAETWTVASSASFPAVEIGAQQFHVADPALPTEMITVTNVAGTTWTVIRGAESTTSLAHTAGFTVVQVVTAGVLAQMQYPSWQFPVQAYGAQGDGKIGTGGTGASGQAVLTDAGASFVNATAPAGDVGKIIIVNQGTGSATSPTNPFCGTISAVNSPTSITLSANLAATCSAAPYVYGTDDASAINSAVTAAANWAVTTGNYKAQVMFEPQLYMLGALTQSTTFSWAPFNSGSYTYNTHIPIPFAGQYSRKLVIDFVGVGDASEPDFWGSAVPSVQGTALVSAVFATSQPNATFGQQSVLGGPATQGGIGNGGITNGGFGNVLANVSGITIATPYNGSQYSFDLRWCAQANIQNAAALTFSPVNLNAQTVGGTWIRSTDIPSNGVATGLAMPAVVNNDNTNVGLFSAEGLAVGLQIAEHFTAQRIATIYCDIGVAVNMGTPQSGAHGGSIAYWSCEGCNVGLSTLNSSAGIQYPLFIGSMDCEGINTWYIDDQGFNLTGTCYWYDINEPSPINSAAVSTRGAARYNIVNTRQYPGPWAVNATLGLPAPPAAPATGVAQQNTARAATVYASASTSISAYAIGATSGSLTTISPGSMSLGANIPAAIRVPFGWWYSVTYTGTLTTAWVLE